MAQAPASPAAIRDRCPYSRAFGPDFRDCPAFTVMEYTPLDTGFRPLQPVITCRHLGAGSEAAGRFYPRCALGGAEERLEWISGVGEERLARLRELSLEYRAWVAPLMAQVWARKGEALAARRFGGDVAPAEARLAEAVAGLIADCGRWIDQRSSDLAAAGLAPEALRALVDAAAREWAANRGAGLGYRIPDSLLERFPPSVRLFIRAGRG